VEPRHCNYPPAGTETLMRPEARATASTTLPQHGHDTGATLCRPTTGGCCLLPCPGPCPSNHTSLCCWAARCKACCVATEPVQVHLTVVHWWRVLHNLRATQHPKQVAGGVAGDTHLAKILLQCGDHIAPTGWASCQQIHFRHGSSTCVPLPQHSLQGALPGPELMKA
jgi:hypothetical protein